MGSTGRRDTETLSEEIRLALRLPQTPAIFAALAADKALAPCWRALAEVVRLRAFEEAADDLRARAAEAAVELGCPLIETQLEWAGYDVDEIDSIREQVNVFHYADAKVLLAATALSLALEGEVGGARGTGRSLMKMPPEVPEEMPLIEPVPEDVDGVLGRCFAEIREHLGVGRIPDDFRALGLWPRYVELAWADARKRDQDPRARNALSDLASAAEAAARALPVRISVPTESLQREGADPGKVRALLTRWRDALPGLVLDLALFKVQLDGAGDARESPFPIDWQYLSNDDYLPGDIDEALKLRAGDPVSLDEPVRARARR